MNKKEQLERINRNALLMHLGRCVFMFLLLLFGNKLLLAHITLTYPIFFGAVVLEALLYVFIDRYISKAIDKYKEKALKKYGLST